MPAIPKTGRKYAKKFHNFTLQKSDGPLLARMAKHKCDLLTAKGTMEQRATAFNLEVGTVKSRIHRARAQLAALRGE